MSDNNLIETLRDDAESQSPIVIIPADNGETFEMTQEHDPQYELYPIDRPRPIKLFKEPLYDRQKGESLLEYNKFLAFASMHPDSRTIQGAWDTWRESDGKKKSYVSKEFRELSAHWRWTDRAFMLDMHRNDIAEQVWIQREIDRREADWGAAGDLRAKALEALENLDATRIGPQAIAKFIQLASSLQQDAIPDKSLDGKTLGNIMESIPESRRGDVIEIAMARIKRG